MAQAASNFYRTRFEGLLLAPRGYVERVKGFKTFEGTHPLPSDQNVLVTQKIVEKVQRLEKNDMLLALISGGTSALLCLPKKGVTLSQKIEATQKLLNSGADMVTFNAKRKKLSAVKGGKLAKLASPASVKTLIVSDVPGDDPAIVGSAPTGGGKIILKADDMLITVATKAKKHGLSVTNLGGAVTGKSGKIAQIHAKLASKIKNRPHLILSGGETSVTLTGQGQGGRNSHYALALAMALKGARDIYGLAIDTDGKDGTGPHAGAKIRPDTLMRAKEQKLNPEKCLKNNDSASFFKKLNDLIITGPTFTNLNDLRMILVM